MRIHARAAQIAVQAVLQPGRACARLHGAPSAGGVLACAAVLHALLAAAQWRVVTPVLSRDPLFTDWNLGGAAGGALQLAVAAAGALALAVRAGVLGSVLHSLSIGSARGAWVAWAACAEGVLWIESAATTTVAALTHPADVAALRAARLHSGLDLVWPHSAGAAAAWLASLNVFTVWWAVLLAVGLSQLGGASRRRAAAIAVACGAGRATLHALWNLG